MKLFCVTVMVTSLWVHWDQHHTTLPLFCSQNPHFRSRGHENLCLKCTRIVKIFMSLRKSVWRNTMVTSDFRPEVEIWPFHTRAMRNMQCNAY